MFKTVNMLMSTRVILLKYHFSLQDVAAADNPERLTMCFLLHQQMTRPEVGKY